MIVGMRGRPTSLARPDQLADSETGDDAMRKTWQAPVAMGIGLALIVGCGGADSPATESMASDEMIAPMAPLAPSTSINAVMVGLVDHAAHHIWDLGRDGMAPESDYDWEEVTHHAIQLIAAGSYITVGGTGQMDASWAEQTGWRGYAQDLEDAGVLALDAANRRDLNGVLAAGDSLIMSCEGCHQEYKPALPTEGIVHPHHY
jgi:hypothetical protein